MSHSETTNTKELPARRGSGPGVGGTQGACTEPGVNCLVCLLGGLESAWALGLFTPLCCKALDALCDLQSDL